MIQKAYSIYDSKAEAYSRPFFAINKAMAIRSFQDIAADQQHPIGQHPEDYTLFEIGQWDDTTSELKNITNISLGCALEYQNKE